MARSRSRLLTSVVAAIPLFVVAIASSPSCSSPSDGERCNISLSHDECASNLSCTVPTNCTYAVCCPSNGSKSTSSACDPCPGEEEAGPEEAGTGGDATDNDGAAPDAEADADANANDAGSDAADAAEGG